MKPTGQGRLRHWIEAAYSFDDRLHERFHASPKVTLVGFFTIEIFLIILVTALLRIQTPSPNVLALLWGGVAITAQPLLIGTFRRRYIKQISNRRLQLNQCVGCGYDLRATVERCPECGKLLVSSEVITSSVKDII